MGVDVRSDLVTWQAIRQIAECEVLTPPLMPFKVLLASMVPDRPQITWAHQYHWIAKAEQVVPEAGGIVYARSAWGKRWRPDLLKRLVHPVVLVSTFYDLMVQADAANALLGPDSPITQWFAVQVNTRHPKLTAMPLGVKTRMVKPLQDGERRDVRDILCYGNFSYHRIGKRPDPIRRAIWQHFSAQPWVTTKAINHEDVGTYVADLGRAKFVLSPPGIGYDCYRTYEAIAMGAIPIVKRQRPITDVCESLPVLLIDDWSEVTPELLQNVWFNRESTSRSTETLTMTYWRKQIQQAAEACRAGALTCL